MKYFSNKVLDKKIKEEGGGTYTAGEGIDISENEISIDSDTLEDIADGAEARSYFDSSGILSTSRDPFWQIGGTSGLVELKSAYSYVGAKKGIIFSVNQSEDANAHLEVVYKTMAGASDPIPVLHSKLPFYSDSFVSAGGLSSGGGGGGGGGATSLEGLDDVEYTGIPVAGQALVYIVRDGVGLWTNATPTGGGTVTTVANVPPTSGGDIPKAELSAALGTGTVTQGNGQLVTGGTVYSAINSAISSVLKFEGVSSTPITDGGTQTPTIGGVQVTPYKGMVVLYGSKEFVWSGSAWEELGDEASWALKTITITGTGYLSGGGSLEANRTIDIAEAVKTKIEHGESAYNRTDWDQYLGIDANGHIYVKDNRGFYSSSFVSAGGVGSGGGGGGGATELADLEDINFVTPITGGQVLMYRDLGGGDGEWYNADIEVGGVKTVANVVPTSGGNIPLADLASAFTTGGYKLTDHEYTNGTGLNLSNGTFSLTQAVQTSLGKADTAIQTVYDLVIKDSGGTTQLTYKPATSGTYSITLTKAMVGLGDVENTKLSTWAGSGNITTVGTISNGTWQGTAIGYNYVAAHYIGGTRTASAAGQATLLGIDAISNAQSSGSSDLSRIVWDATNNAWHFLGNLYADGFVSAGGMSDSGGGGGASYLYELKDFQSGQSKATDTGTMLMYQATGITDVNGNTGAWKYASPSDVASAIGLGDYLPLTGGVMNTNAAISWGDNSRTDWATYVDGIRIMSSISTSSGAPTQYCGGINIKARYGFMIAGAAAADRFYMHREGGSWRELYHTGNLSLATLAGSTGVGSIAQPVYYTGSSFALVQATFGNASYGEHDADNIASNGLWYYNSNGPATSLGASTTDGALYSQAYSTSWVGQIAQDYRNGHLYVRGKNNGTWQSWLKVWDSGNSNSTSVNWSASTLTANYAHLGNGNSITNLELFGSATGSAIGFYKSGTRVALLYSNGDAPFQRYSGDWTIGYTIYDSGNSNKSDVPWTCSTLTSSVATGTAPLTVASTTMVDNLNANYLGGYTLDNVVPHSAYSYGNGYLVKTGFGADATRHYLITIEGSAYNYSPIFSQAEVYTNQTTSTNTAFAYAYVVHYGRMKINNLQAFFYGGLLYIWFQQPRTYCAIKVKVQYHNASANYVTAISNAAIPSSGVTCLTSFAEYQGAFTDGNVASATKLQTERTIWGQSFDGTGNVNGLITVSGIGGAAITQEKGANTVFRLGSGSSATTAGTEYGILSLFQNGTEMVRLYANSSNPSWINAGSFGVGTASPGAKFHVYGTSGASITPMSVFEHTGDYQWNCPTSFLAPNVTAGHSVSFGIGKAASTKNQGSLQFYYAGSSSDSNLFGLGLYGVDYALTVSGGGNVGIGLGTTAAIYTLHVAGASAALINSSGPVYQLISAGTNGWSYIRLSSGASSDTVWDLATTNSTSSAIAQVGAFEIRDGKDSAAGISIRHASSDYGKLVVRVNSGQSSIGYWSTSNNLVSGYPIWTVGYTADTGDTFGWYCKSSTPGWKMNLSPNGDLTNTGSIYTNRIFLRRSTNNAYGRIGFYSSSYYTWYFYMGPTGSGYPCPTGAATPSGSVVTSWALRSLIENASGYGWTWESCSNGHNQTPVIQMELSSNTGVLRTRGDQVISSDINLKKNIKDLDLTVEQIARLPAVTFDWKDGRGSTFGTVAQGVLPIFPQAVRGNEGNYSVVYGQGGWVFGVKNAREIVSLKSHETEQDKEIRKLKARVRDLEKQLELKS